MGFDRRLALVALLVLMPAVSWPSEGLPFMAAYLCDPIPMTNAVIDRCMSLRPELRATYASLRNDWHHRNDAPGAELKKRCDAFAMGQSTTDQAQFKQRVQELNAQATAQKIAEIEAHPETCQSLLDEISSGKADLRTFVDSRQ
jgi:hypothetical protein